MTNSCRYGKCNSTAGSQPIGIEYLGSVRHPSFHPMRSMNHTLQFITLLYTTSYPGYPVTGDLMNFIGESVAASLYLLGRPVLQQFVKLEKVCCCCCLPCDHCSNWTWVVEEILAYSIKLRFTHCREFHYLKLCRPAYFVRTT